MRINTLFDNEKDNMILKLQNQISYLGQISIQLDIWTSITSKSYLGVIANWLNSNFELEYKVIGM